MFTKAHLKKMTELNQEHALATPTRRKEIEAELINMVPDELKAPSPSVEVMIELQENLKRQINELAACATQADFHIFFQKLDDLDKQVCDYAETLGVTLPRTDYETMKNKMIKLRSKHENK